VLDAHRHPDQVRGDAGLGLLLGQSCWWVVDAGWITSVLASPTLARWLASSTPSMDERAAS
jgi:hypothetical protein